MVVMSPDRLMLQAGRLVTGLWRTGSSHGRDESTAQAIEVWEYGETCFERTGREVEQGIMQSTELAK